MYLAIHAQISFRAIRMIVVALLVFWTFLVMTSQTKYLLVEIAESENRELQYAGDVDDIGIRGRRMGGIDNYY